MLLQSQVGRNLPCCGKNKQITKCDVFLSPLSPVPPAPSSISVLLKGGNFSGEEKHPPAGFFYFVVRFLCCLWQLLSPANGVGGERLTIHSRVLKVKCLWDISKPG